MKVRGKLTSPTGAFDFSGYRVRVRFRQLAPLPGLEGDPEATLMGPAETSAATNASGDYEISLDDALKPGGPFEWAVLAPDGRVVEAITFDQAPTADLDFRVRPLEPPQPATEPDSRPTAAQRLVGRLLDHLGKSSTTGDVTIVMFGKAVAADPFSPLAVFRTDPQGYFSGERPDGKFAEVVARVAIDGQLVELPIRLIDSQVPLRVLLVLPAPEQRPASDGAAAPHDAPCDCDKPKPPLGASPEDVVNAVGTYTSDLGGACVQFTTPNRSIDEFTYYALIRTTDPDIKGLTLGPDRKLPPKILDGIVKSAALISLAERSARLPAPAPDRGPLDRTALARDVAPDLLGRHVIDDAEVTHVTTGPNPLRVSARALAALGTESDTFTVEDLAAAERLTTSRDVRDALSIFRKPVAGRAPLSAANPVDWDDEPQFYQATTIAHGHLLHFKQVWRANGYSLGDLLYSLPLAPGQKKQIVVLDWERREEAARQEATEVSEDLEAGLVRDRDINEIVSSTLKESSRGASAAVTKGQGGVGGALTGAVVAVAGGLGFSGSVAWQSASRKFAADTSQHLRDQTLQSASSVRSQRSTVIQTAEQGESVRVTTEVVANHNHCHAITVQYFEVLRHLLVTQELADVQECLFIPLLMSKFDSPKALRWRDALVRHLRARALIAGFDALERIATNYANADFPAGRFEQETLEELEGDLRISFVLPRPRDKDNGDFDDAAWGWLVAGGLLWASPLEIFNLQLKARVDAERDRAWHREVAPRIAERFVQKLKFAVRTAGGTEVNVALDTTLVSRYVADVPLFVSVRPTGSVPAVARVDIRYFVIRGTTALPPDARVIVESGQMRYRTAHLQYWLFRDTRIANDLRSDDPDGVIIATPTDDRERRDPRKEDRELSRKLLAHLNERLWVSAVDDGTSMAFGVIGTK